MVFGKTSSIELIATLPGKVSGPTVIGPEKRIGMGKCWMFFSRT
jgi:hypothetical protein